jgi:hypothetical protein
MNVIRSSDLIRGRRCDLFYPKTGPEEGKIVTFFPPSQT